MEMSLVFFQTTRASALTNPDFHLQDLATWWPTYQGDSHLLMGDSWIALEHLPSKSSIGLPYGKAAVFSGGLLTADSSAARSPRNSVCNADKKSETRIHPSF